MNQQQEGKEAAQHNKKEKIVLVARRPWPQRLLFFALKWALILFSFVVALLLGATVGFGLIGGEDWRLVWDLDTWKHIYNLVFAD